MKRILPRRCLITERERAEEGEARSSGEQKQEEFLGDTFARRKDNLLPPIILEVEVELKGKKQ